MDIDRVAERVLALIRPHLLAAAKDSAARTRRSLAYSLPRPARVESFNTKTGEAIVTVDGDTGQSAAQVVTGYPLRNGDRVFTLFVPPHGLLVFGHATGFPVIANLDDTGLLTSLTTGFANVKSLVIGNEPIASAYQCVARTDYTLESVSAGALDVEVEIGVSVDGGTNYVTAVSQASAAASGRRASGSVTVTNAGAAPEYRPRIRVRARSLATPSGSYELRGFFTSWTITPQVED